MLRTKQTSKEVGKAIGKKKEATVSYTTASW